MRREGLTRLRIGATAISFEGVMEGLKIGGKDNAISFDYMSLVKRVVENDFKHVELTLDIYYVFPSSFSKENVEGWKSMRDEGITFSAHLPLLSLGLDSPIEDVRKASVNSVVKPVEVLEDLKPLIYVLHMAGPLAAEVNRMEIGETYKQLFFEALSKNSSESVERIVSSMSDMGVEPRRIALESIEFPFSKTLELAEAFDTSICIDTGHILAGYSGKISVEEALKLSSERLGEIHLHDAYRRKKGDSVVIKDHLPLGSGDMNVQSFLKTLEEVKFTGPIVFELGLKDAKISLQKLAHEK
ncbi:MAG: cobamide remodeling phosphodiesterase CbiR [Thermoproteota archaeon]